MGEIMERNNLIKKGVVVAVILLFVSVSVIPSTGNRAFSDDITPPVTTCTLNPPEPNGNNSWYVSDVKVTLNATDDMSGVNVTYYRLNGGEWKTYVEPFTIESDDNYVIEYYSVDNEGNVEDVKSAEFKIDQTPPIIDLTWESYKEDGIWYVIFLAYCSDATSGMNYVEFYVDDVLQFTDNSEPYEWTILWPPSPPLPSKYFVKGFIFGRQFDEQNVTFYALIVRIIEYLPDLPEPLIYATAYDIAGNSETDYLLGSSTTVSVHMFERLTFSNYYTGRIGFFFIDAEFEEGPL